MVRFRHRGVGPDNGIAEGADMVKAPGAPRHCSTPANSRSWCTEQVMAHPGPWKAAMDARPFWRFDFG